MNSYTENSVSIFCSASVPLGKRAHAIPIFYLLVIITTLMSSTSWAANSLSQFGITWTFDKELTTDGAGNTYQFGQFANGDYCVVGPVTIIGVDPPSFVGDGIRTMETGTPNEWVPEVGRTVNGALISPDPIVYQQGYDSASTSIIYNESLNVARKDGVPVSSGKPLELPANNSLISSISLDHSHSEYAPHQGYMVKSAAVLTILDKPAPKGSFRPPYSGIDKTIKFNESQLNYHLLGTLDKKDFADSSDLKMNHWTDPQKSSAERAVDRPWIDHIGGCFGEVMAPIENMLSYPGYRTRQLQQIAMLLNVDWTGSPEFVSNDQYKRNLLVSTIQIGIDLYGIYQAGAKNHWPPDGGHGIGRKWPILFTGVMLEGGGAHADANAMANIGFNDDDDPRFSEDDQSFYVNQDNLDAQNAVYTGQYPARNWADPEGVCDSTSNPNHCRGTCGPDYREPLHIPYTQSDVDNKLPEWGIRYATNTFMCNRAWGTMYREGTNNANFPGLVLSMYIMDLKSRWNHDSFFDFMDRYIAIEKEIKVKIIAGGGRDWYGGYIWDDVNKVTVPVVHNIPGTPATDIHGNVVNEEFHRHYVCSSAFVEKMWDACRADYGSIWTADSDNSPPVLTAIGNKSVSENSILSFSITATDADGDTITYSAQGLPSGAMLDPQTGEFAWTPGYTQSGTYQVTFAASDGQAQDSETITITVSNINQAPVLATVGDKSVNENSSLSFSVSATDADGDTITYSVQSLPSGAVFGNQTFTWTPGYTQVGTHQVTFTASDGTASDFETITITVNNTNQPPVLGSVGNKSVYTENSLTFTVSATDADSDTITYSATGLPSGATFSGQNFSWTPGSSQAGSYDVTFTASDSQTQDSETITITVTADTSAPTVTNLSPAADSIQAPLNSLIYLDVTDSGKGVNTSTVTIEVNSNLVYTGNTTDYSSSYGHCRRIGTSAAYTYVYQADEMFDYDQTVTVTVNAADLAANSMDEYSYSFKTEMRSFGENRKANSSSNNLNDSSPATASDSSGNIWAVWHTGQTGSRDIYAGKLTAGADSFGDSAQVTNDNADQCNPAIAIDSADKLYVVWQDNRNGEWDIYVSTSTDGTNFSSERKVTDPNSDQINPAAVIDSSDKAYIVWEDDRNNNKDIYIASSSNSFVSYATSQITSNASDQITPAVAVDSGNTVYVVWMDARSGTNDIYGADSTNGPWTNVAVVSNANNQSSPAIAAEASGTILHLLWVDNTSGNNDIYYASSNGLPGSPLNGSSIIDDDSGADQSAPVITTTGSTGNDLKVFACWKDGRNISSGNGDTDIYFVEANSGSGTNVLVGDDGTNSAQSYPAMGIDGYGYPHLVWTDDRNTATNIYYAGSTFVESAVLESEDLVASSGATVGTELASINSATDVSVTIPAEACSHDATITISRIKNPPKLTLDNLGTLYEFGPSGIEFDHPVTIIIPYDLSTVGNSPSAYWYNPLTSVLSQQGITDIETVEISSTLHALHFKTTHFTQFLVGGDIAAAAGESGSGGGWGLSCSMSPNGQGSIVEFLLPYIGLTVVMTILKLQDKHKKKMRDIAKSE